MPWGCLEGGRGLPAKIFGIGKYKGIKSLIRYIYIFFLAEALEIGAMME